MNVIPEWKPRTLSVNLLFEKLSLLHLQTFLWLWSKTNFDSPPMIRKSNVFKTIFFLKKIYTCMASITLQTQDVKKLMAPPVEGINGTHFSYTAIDTSITTQSRNKQILFSAMITLKIKSLCTLVIAELHWTCLSQGQPRIWFEHSYFNNVLKYNSTLVVF